MSDIQQKWASYLLLHHLVIANQLTRSHRHGLMERHASWEVSVFRVGGCFFEGSEVVFAFIVFFFTTVVAVWTFRAVASIVGSTMSVIALLVMVPKSSYFSSSSLLCSVWIWMFLGSLRMYT